MRLLVEGKHIFLQDENCPTFPRLKFYLKEGALCTEKRPGEEVDPISVKGANYSLSPFMASFVIKICNLEINIFQAYPRGLLHHMYLFQYADKNLKYHLYGSCSYLGLAWSILKLDLLFLPNLSKEAIKKHCDIEILYVIDTMPLIVDFYENRERFRRFCKKNQFYENRERFRRFCKKNQFYVKLYLDLMPLKGALLFGLIFYLNPIRRLRNSR